MLQNRIRETVQTVAARTEEALSAKVAISVMDPALDLDVGFRDDVLVHAASTMKIPVMIEAFRRVEEGTLSLDESVVVDATCVSILDGSTFEVDAHTLLSGKLGETVSIRTLIEQMMVVSDNLATNLLLARLGPERITETMRACGATDGSVLRGVQDIPAYEAGISNRISARDLSRMLVAIETGQRFDGSPAPVRRESSLAEMRQILLDQRFNDTIPPGLPDGVAFGHKTGSISGHRHDAGLVYAGIPGETGTRWYALAILISDCPGLPADDDEPDEAKQAAATMAREIHGSWAG